MLDAALAALSHGWSLVPVTPGQKSPPLIAWEPYQKRRPTEAEVRQWWTQWPSANLAIVCGAISDLTVIDVDGPEGEETARHIQGLPPTRVVKTPKGHHLYYHYSPEFHTGARFLPGIDARSEGGYVLAPPSVVDGKPYVVTADQPIAATEFTPAEFQARHRQGQSTPATDQPKWVSLLLAKGATEGTRNDKAIKLAGYFQSKGLPPDVIRQCMAPFAQACQPPFPERELEIVIQSATRYPSKAVAPEPLPPLSLPQFQPYPGVYLVDWVTEGFRFRLSHVREHSDVTTCEFRCEVISGPSPLPFSGPDNLNLTSPRSRAEIAKNLASRRNGLDWAEMLQQACALTIEHYRLGEPMVPIGAERRNVERQWALWPIVPLHQTAILFGPGGSAKSTLAAYFAVLVHGGLLAKGLRPIQTNVAYLDWETDEDTVNDTCWGISHALNLNAPVVPFYRRCYRPLDVEMEGLQELIIENHIGMVIVDSAMPAAGSTKDAKEQGGTLIPTLRALGTSNLIVAHVTKNPIGGATPYGDVFLLNLARHALEVRASLVEGEEQALDVALFNTKTNMGPLRPPLAYRLHWRQDGGILVSDQDANALEMVQQRQNTMQRVYVLLKQRGPMTVPELAMEIDPQAEDAKGKKLEGAISKTLRRSSWAVNLDPMLTGRGNSPRWGLHNKAGQGDA